MPKGPKITTRQVRSISRRLAMKDPAETIAKVLKISLTTVNRVRADYRAITYEVALDRLEPNEYLADPEYRHAERRAKGVSSEWRAAIIQGIVDAQLKATDILDGLTEDPRLASTILPVDPAHDPRLLYENLRKQRS